MRRMDRAVAIESESVPHRSPVITWPSTRPHSLLSLLVLVAFSGVALRLLWLSRAWPLVHDVPIMHYVAWRIAGGAVPYRDVFDMNFPGAYLLHLAVLSTLGPGDVA